MREVRAVEAPFPVCQRAAAGLKKPPQGWLNTGPPSPLQTTACPLPVLCESRCGKKKTKCATWCQPPSPRRKSAKWKSWGELCRRVSEVSVSNGTCFSHLSALCVQSEFRHVSSSSSSSCSCSSCSTDRCFLPRWCLVTVGTSRHGKPTLTWPVHISFSRM